MAELSQDEARSLVTALTELVQMADRALPHRVSPLTQRLRDHLGTDGDAVPNTSVTFGLHEHANVQLAMNALQESDPEWEEIGLPGDVSHYGGFSLVGLIGSSERFGVQPTARQFVNADVGVDETLACLRAGLILTQLGGEPVAILMYLRDQNHPPGVVVEIAAPTQATTDAVLARLRELMDERNVFRGKVLSFTFSRHGGFGLNFVAVPDVQREQVILAGELLDAIEEHAVGISEHSADLRSRHQHVKRGLLLYGPPGTGKTHTISYLLNRSAGRTTIILAGAAVGAIGQAGSIARALQPATIVVEDVDLIGMDRSLPGGEHNTLLFQLLNEMDGLSGDADVLFILTTNRVDLLEPALAARPGRVDQAIEIGLPDAAARGRLVDLYVGEALTADVRDAVIAGTEGFAAAFIKELARRATLASLRRGDSLSDSVVPALDALLHQSAPVLRRTLAGEATADAPGIVPAPAPGPGVVEGGWFQYRGG
jgi:cell division protease FtsH